MKLYVSHSRNIDYEECLYNPLLKSNIANRYELVLPHTKKWENINTKDVIRECDVLIAEITFPAIGVGIEIGRAEESNIRIIAVIKKGEKINSSVKRITSEIIEYESVEELMKKLDATL